MRADRLLSILLLLQVHGRLPAHDLARRLEVSERTIHRDMEALSAAGIPVVAERGTGGGWSLLDSYQTNLTGLSEPEIQALFLARPSRLLADLGMRQAFEAGLLKLLAALPSLTRQGAEYARQRIHIDPAGWFESPENVACLPILQAAVWQESRVRLVYQRGDGERVERQVDPLGLVAKGSVWYLVAGVEGEIRTYRVSRVREAFILDQRATRPPDFDLAAYWEQSAQEFKAALPRYLVVLRAHPDALPRLRAGRYARVQYVSAPDADGWMQVTVDFETLDEACRFTLSLGTMAEALEPPELRQYILETAQAVAAFYEQTKISVNL